MSKIAFETLLDDVMPELPQCSTDMALFHIRRVINDFGEKTRFLRTWLPLIDVQAGTAAYSIVPPDTDFQLLRPEEVRFLGTELDPVGIDELNAEIPEWRTELGEPRLYTREDDATINLVYVPSTDAAQGLKVKVSYTPDFQASGFDAVLYSRFADGIAAGVKSRLMVMPKKPWSAPEQAVYYDSMYKIEINVARQAADKELSRARRRTATYFR